MSVQEVVPYSEALGNGVSKQFPLGFPCDKKESLKVKINEIEVQPEFWSLNQNTVTFDKAPEKNVLIQFERSTKAMRTTDYATYNDSLRGDVLNYDFDRIWWKLQELGLADWLLGLRIDKEIKDRIAADIYYYTFVTKETNYKINELKEYLEALVNNLTGGDFLPILDKYIKTWSGRTQEQHNKENPSPFDFNAKGDVVTNDTQAFIELETEYQGQIIDLLGKTYLVDVDFNKNQYVNGYFKINNVSKKQGVKTFKTSVPLEDKSGIQIATLKGGIQGAILSEFDNTLYVLQGVDGTVNDNTERNKIVAFRWNGQTELTSTWETLPSDIIGHQSLGQQRVAYGTRNTTGTLKLWSIAGVDKGVERSKYAVRFEVASGAAPSIVEHYKLWGDDVVGGTRVLGTDQNSSILVMTGIRSDGWYCRVFDLTVFEVGGGDYSNKYLYEFKTNNLGVALQDITTDGNYVYLYHGGTAFSSTNKYLEVYTVDGVHVRTMKTTVGALRAWQISEAGGTLMYEPEAIFLDHGELVFGNTNGIPFGETLSESSFFKLQPKQALHLKPSSSLIPALILNATHDIAIPNPSALNISYAENDGGLINFYSLKDNEMRHTSQSGGIIHYIIAQSGDSQIRLTNATKTCGLNLSAAGHFGLYDYTVGNWIISANNTGYINMHRQLKLSTISMYSDNTTAKSGGLTVGDVYRTSTGQLMIVY